MFPLRNFISIVQSPADVSLELNVVSSRPGRAGRTLEIGQPASRTSSIDGRQRRTEPVPRNASVASDEIQVVAPVASTDRFVVEATGTRGGALERRPRLARRSSIQLAASSAISALSSGAASAAQGIADSVYQGASSIGHGAASVGSGVVGGVGRGVSAIGNGAVAGVRGVGLAIGSASMTMPKLDRVVALGGSVAFQLVSCGIPTVARELANSFVFGKLVDNPREAMAYLGGVYALKFFEHWMFHGRMNRDMPAAARGYHGLTQAQWDSKNTEERRALVGEVQHRMRLVTTMDLAASIVGLVAAAVALHTGHTQLPSILVGNEVRNAVYGVTRELISGSIKAIKPVGDTVMLTPSKVESLAGSYGALQFSSAYLQAYILTKILPSNISVNGAVLNVDTAEQTLARISAREAWRLLSIAAALRAVVNIGVETTDGYGDQRLSVRDTGGKYVPIAWEWNTDQNRVLCHSIARQSWNNFAMIATPLTHFIEDQQLAALTNHLLRSFLYAASYPTVNSIYKAAASVRAAVKQRASSVPEPDDAPRLTFDFDFEHRAAAFSLMPALAALPTLPTLPTGLPMPLQAS